MKERPMDEDTITLRSAEPADAAAISALLGSPGAFEGTLQLPDMPVASRLEFLQKFDPGCCRLVALAGDQVIGTAGLHYPAPGLRRAHARSLGIVVAREWQGRGVGRRLLRRLLDWADNWGGVLRVELWAHADNERAIALYRSLGFVEEGRHRGYALRGGQFVDSVSMARLHPQPPAIRTPAG
jgi:putative acetyltransferase